MGLTDQPCGGLSYSEPHLRAETQRQKRWHTQFVHTIEKSSTTNKSYDTVKRRICSLLVIRQRLTLSQEAGFSAGSIVKMSKAFLLSSIMTTCISLTIVTMNNNPL